MNIPSCSKEWRIGNAFNTTLNDYQPIESLLESTKKRATCSANLLKFSSYRASMNSIPMSSVGFSGSLSSGLAGGKSLFAMQSNSTISELYHSNANWAEKQTVGVRSRTWQKPMPPR